MPILLFATLDTKGSEAVFVRDRLRSLGADVQLVDTGSLAAPTVVADIPREAVFAAAGVNLAELRARQDRGEAVAAAARGAAQLALAAHARGELSGVMGIGGSAGTTIATTAMRALPLGVPKIMVSTLASGNVRSWVEDRDIFMLNSVVDIAGLNRISRTVLDEAARAIAGMVLFPHAPAESTERPLIAATMFGVTTPCVTAAKQILETAGYEVLVFHATGSGGRAMERLIEEGHIAGVLDITTTELADELVGGVLSAGPDRLNAAGRKGTPQVISVGALDMVNFGPRDTVPPPFLSRKFHQHNPTVTLMRTTPAECAELGKQIGERAAAATGPVTILLPAEGVSAIDRAGQPFEDREARTQLYAAIRRHAGKVEVRELPCHINDELFARTAAESLLQQLH
jgi:uncharacterized protein (UPF0261 family)